MERNLHLYLVYQACRNLTFWLPVFFLYFSSLVSLEEVLLLEAVYYLAVVLFELPSGYFSDRVGRRITLLVAMASWTASCLLFAASSSFWPLAAAQVLMAGGMAFNSGTDTSLLYDSLAAVGRENEIGEREAKAHSVHYASMAAAALIGGLAAGIDLRIAYVLSAGGAAAAFAVVLAFREPRHAGAPPAHPPLRQMTACALRLGDPVLLWVFVFIVGMTVFNHVPYEFFQPYLDFLLGSPEGDGYRPTPAVSGVIVSFMMLVSALASGRAMAVRRRLGVAGTLLAAMALQGIIIVSMALVVHPVVVALILLRSLPRAVFAPVANAAIHPRLETPIRATYLSMQSLAGRLAFSVTLFLSSVAVTGTGRITPELMSRLLWAYAALLLIVFTGLSLGSRALDPTRRQQAKLD